MEGSVAGSFQHPTSLSPQCETMLRLLGEFKGVKEQHLEEGREAWGGVWSLCLAGHPLLSSLLFSLSVCIQTGACWGLPREEVVAEGLGTSPSHP